ncbi:MAG: prolyl oligopeptidase family serine peptidase [Steroidobacteraceae bacterium]
MSRQYTVWLGLLAVALAAPGAAANLKYPQAERGDTVDVYHGVRIADPYRGLEALDSEATRQWVQAQNRLAEPYLQQLSQRAWLKRRLNRLTDYERRTTPQLEGGRYFQLRNTGTLNQSVLYVADSVFARGRILLDPNKLSGDATVALAQFEPDPRGKLLAYSLSDGGSDWQSWHVRNVDTGKDLPDVLTDTKFTGVSWARDGSGFYYSRYPKRADGRGDDQRQPRIYFHSIGTPQSADTLIFSVTDHPTRTPYGTVTDDGRYLVVAITEGTLTNGVNLLPLAAQGRPPVLPEGGVGSDAASLAKPLFADWDALYSLIGVADGELYFWTTSGAPLGRVIAVRPEQPRREQWRSVIAESADALVQTSLVAERLIAVYLHDAHSLVRIHTLDGAAQNEVQLPGLGSVSGFGGHREDRETYFSYTDFANPSRLLRLWPAAGEAVPLWQPRLRASTRDYVTEQVFYTSRDGTRVPMFLVHKRSLQKDGQARVLLYGYGGFDISITPGFSSSVLAWLEMGGVYAVANLRGGGEYGRAWHEAGAVLNKQNVFDDFIAAAQYLVRENYTQPGYIAISGRSNGGLLVGATLTQRPDLFGAALPGVGVLDMLRYHTASANARQWSSDYGLSENEAEFKAQLAYSPLHNVHAGTCYPPTLITTADHDDRVVPWHSFKFAATLQAAQAQTAAAHPGCSAPVLIRVETRAGHGSGKPLWMQIEDEADRMGFAANAIGLRAP